MWVIFGKLRDFRLNDLLKRLSTALPALLSRALSRARRNFKLTTRWSPQAKPVRRRSCQKHKNLHSQQTSVVQYSRVEWISFEHLPHLYLEKCYRLPFPRGRTGEELICSFANSQSRSRKLIHERRRQCLRVTFLIFRWGGRRRLDGKIMTRWADSVRDGRNPLPMMMRNF